MYKMLSAIQHRGGESNIFPLLVLSSHFHFLSLNRRLRLEITTLTPLLSIR